MGPGWLLQAVLVPDVAAWHQRGYESIKNDAMRNWALVGVNRAVSSFVLFSSSSPFLIGERTRDD